MSDAAADGTDEAAAHGMGDAAGGMRDTPDPERATLEAQTQRNLQGMELERGGDQDAAIELYEQNLREAFEADWPYGRLVAIYERRGRPQDAIRVLQRGMEVFKASKRRTPQDRRAVISIFRNRIREIERKQQAAARGAAFQARVAAREAAARDRQAAREAAARERAARREAAAQARAAKSWKPRPLAKEETGEQSAAP